MTKVTNDNELKQAQKELRETERDLRNMKSLQEPVDEVGKVRRTQAIRTLTERVIAYKQNIANYRP